MDDFARDEFRESYAHYRHLEVQRTQQLSIFFAVAGGVGTVVAFLFKDAGSIPELTGARLILASFLGLFLQVVAIVTTAALRRLGEARNLHEKIIREIRDQSGQERIVTLLTDFDKTRNKWLSVQGAAEVAVLALSFLAASGTSAIWFSSTIADPLLTWALTVAPILMFAFQLAVQWKLSPSRSSG